MRYCRQSMNGIVVMACVIFAPAGAVGQVVPENAGMNRTGFSAEVTTSGRQRIPESVSASEIYGDLFQAMDRKIERALAENRQLRSEVEELTRRVVRLEELNSKKP